MSFWSAASTAWRVSREYPAAWAAAQRVLEAGGSATAAVRAFAAETSDAFDDQAAAHLSEGLTLGITYAQRAATQLGRIAATIEAEAPARLAQVNDGALRFEQWVWEVASRLAIGLMHLTGVAQRAARKADDVAALAARAGVACTKASIRLAQLKGHE